MTSVLGWSVDEPPEPLREEEGGSPLRKTKSRIRWRWWILNRAVVLISEALLQTLLLTWTRTKMPCLWVHFLFTHRTMAASCQRVSEPSHKEIVLLIITFQGSQGCIFCFSCWKRMQAWEKGKKGDELKYNDDHGKQPHFRKEKSI